MIARKLTPQEAYLSRRNMAVAFEGFFDPEKELEKSKTEEADPTADHWGAFLEEDGAPDPVASLVMNKLDVRFDGHIVKMGGVGGVATLPPYRRSGGIRACMQAAFRDLYDSGFALSALYPFSSAYYRQFGFEVGEHSIRWDIPLSELKLPQAGGKITQLFPGDDLSPLLEVYNAMYGGVNLSGVRKEFDSALQKANFFEGRQSVFLWENGDGVPAGCIIGGRSGETLNCRTDFVQKNALLFRDTEALRALLDFVHRAFIANYENICFSVPGYFDVRTALPEVGNAVKGSISLNNIMVRAANVQKLLELAKCRGQGSLTLEVRDTLLPENDGLFKLEFAPGKENRVEKLAEGKAQISLGVGDLAALLLGIKTPFDFPWMEHVRVFDDDAPFDDVFYRKRCHTCDLF